jgi:hypothetical protein
MIHDLVGFGVLLHVRFHVSWGQRRLSHLKPQAVKSKGMNKIAPSIKSPQEVLSVRHFFFRLSTIHGRVASSSNGQKSQRWIPPRQL